MQVSLSVDENTDVDAVVSSLSGQCRAAGINEVEAQVILQELRIALSNLIEQGKTLAARGSQITVSKELKGPGYNIKVNFGAGQPKSLWREIIKRLWKR